MTHQLHHIKINNKYSREPAVIFLSPVFDLSSFIPEPDVPFKDEVPMSDYQEKTVSESLQKRQVKEYIDTSISL